MAHSKKSVKKVVKKTAKRAAKKTTKKTVKKSVKKSAPKNSKRVKSGYDHNEHVAATSRAKREKTSDIGELPPVKNPKRREKGEKDFAYWRAHYCKPRHEFDDSLNHAKLCDRLQTAIESKDAWFGIMAPRGEGKSSTIVEAFAWSIVTERKKFPIGFSSSSATTSNFVRSFSSLFLDLPAIAEDYPEIIVPLKAKTDTNMQRRVVYHNKTVRCSWASLEKGQYWFRFPDIPGSGSCFAHMMTQSIGSKIRGPFYAAPDGNIIRPDLVVFDDIQDPEIAANPDRIDGVWNKMVADAAGMSGNSPMPLINSGTPFHTECLMARTMRDRRFNGVAYRSIYSYPKRMDLWEDYHKLWKKTYDEKAAEVGDEKKEEANAYAFLVASMFYSQHQSEMDEGMVMSWPAKYSVKGSGISAIENIMREYFIGLEPEVFEQEKNCVLRTPANEDVEVITEDIFLSKVDHSLAEFVCPNEASLITFAIDVHKNILYFEGCTWSDGFDGHVITFGTFPKQTASSWTQRNAGKTLAKRFPKIGWKGALLAGLNELVETIMSRKYYREDGSEIYVEAIIIDNNSGDFKPTVDKFIEESPYREKLLAYKGEWYGSGSQPKQTTEKGGLEWKWNKKVRGRNDVVAFRDFWKSYNLDLWLTPRGETGCKTIFKGGLQQFRKFFNEITAQKPRWITLKSGQSLRRWPTTKDMKGIDDHFGDVDFMTALAASIRKIRQAAEKTGRRTSGTKPISFADSQEDQGHSPYDYDRPYGNYDQPYGDGSAYGY